ncbi:MAG: hypothetical protein WCC06_11460 [Candidatus Aminicenantales bacterium]
MNSHKDMVKIFKTDVFISAVLIASLFIYLLIIEIVKAGLKPFMGLAPSQEIQTLRYFFYALAILLVILNRVLNQFLLKKSPLDDMEKRVQKLHRATLISMALSETPVLLGLVLFFLWGLWKDFYALLIVSLFLNFMYFPRRKNWEDYIQNQSLSCRLN